MIFAIFSGIDTIFNPTDIRALANLGYALASVAIHAVLVPAGVILSFLPVSAIEEVSKLRGVLRDRAQAFVRNANIGPVGPNFPQGGAPQGAPANGDANPPQDDGIPPAEGALPPAYQGGNPPENLVEEE
jgi:hypothetical protein